jgi:hypothetical protein
MTDDPAYARWADTLPDGVQVLIAMLALYALFAAWPIVEKALWVREWMENND